MNVPRVLGVAVACGVVGWALENTLSGPGRYSKAFGGARIPFLPTYAIGGAAVMLAEPTLAPLPLPARFVAYAAGLSALELGACAMDRSMVGRRSWNYGPSLGGGCVDLPHAAAWGALALMLERVMA